MGDESKLFSRAFLSKIGALVLLLSLFFVPLVVQSTSAAFTSGATANTTVSSYASWNPSNLSVVAEPEENVSTVTDRQGRITQLTLSYTPQITFSWREPEYISPGSDTYYFSVTNSAGSTQHSSYRQGGSPGATVSVDLSSYTTSWAGNTYNFNVRNSLISNSSYITKSAKINAFPSSARNYYVTQAVGLTGMMGTKITITAPPGTTISNMEWPQRNGALFGTIVTDTNTKKEWGLANISSCTLYTNITPITYRFYHSATGTYGPTNTINISNCSTTSGS